MSAPDDARHMARAIELAQARMGETWPNPAVGCVLVNDGEIVAEAATAQGGRPHAEEQAVPAAGDKARGATAYVTLEPCAHHGRTPPCAEALVRYCEGGQRPVLDFGCGTGLSGQALRAVGFEVIDGVDWSSPAAISDAVAPFDIGLYPLFAGPFNDYKCGFKALEYMATGIPVLASDAANHAEIVEEGVSGHLLRSPDDWVRALSDLAGNTAKRRAMGAAGRKIVEDRFDTRRIAADLEGILSDGR